MSILKRFGLKWLLLKPKSPNLLHARFQFDTDAEDQVVDIDLDMSKKSNTVFYQSLIDYYINFLYNN